ncbi:MAG: SDR family NAD(P)-dependent oxidoreductase [Anaerolineaceae bacterium]|nr:SDR family NAD(P)-dependent oxidoreductase [Anaerolineaceae bacterium]
MTSVPLDLTGKVVLITGGANGIGEATAKLCVERGAVVVTADMNAEAGERSAAAIRAQGGQIDFIQTDVRSAESVSALMDSIKQKHGRLDKMVCAAGVLRGPWLQPEELPLEEFELTMDVNVKGSFLCAKYATPLLVESDSAVIINVASGAGVIGPSSSLAYGASKGGANGFSMTLANHLKDRNVRVNTLCPGNIVTQMKLSVDVAAAQRDGRSVEDAMEKARQNYGVPEGVAKIIAFMISDEADYLRGALFTR